MPTKGSTSRAVALLLSLVMMMTACSSDGGSSGSSESGSTDSSSEGNGSETSADGGSDDGGSDEEGSAGTTLAIALGADVAPTGFDAQRYAAAQFEFYSTVYDALFVTDENGEVQPSVVETFENSEDGTVLTLTLREGVTFGDGSPLDAALVKANLDRRNEDTVDVYGAFKAGQETEIASVDVVDDYVVAITWAAPQEQGHTLLADTIGIVIGPAGIADVTSLEAAPDGSGPYELVADATTRASSYTLAKKADHWNADAWAFDTVVFEIIPDAQARANAVLSGQVDVADELAASTLDLVESEGMISKAGGIIASYPVIDKDGVIHPAFAFTETRLALSYAINREELVAALRPGARPTANFFPQAAEGFDPALDDAYAYDPDKARELLESVGFGDGFEFDMRVLGEPTDAQLAVQAMWQEVGVTMNLVVVTATEELFSAVTETPLIYNEAWALGNAPAGFVAGVLVGGFMNLLGAENEAISGALGPALGGDPAALAELNAAVVNEGWWISLWEDFVYAGYDADTVAEPPFAGTGGFLVTSAIEPAG